MHVCSEANLASSSSWMFITYIYPYCWFVFHPFVDDWQKGGERFWVYICIFEFLHILKFRKCILCWVYASCVLQNRENVLECLNKKGEKVFREKNFWFMYFLSPCLCIYICLVLYTSLNILLFIVMHELRGRFYEAWL